MMGLTRLVMEFAISDLASGAVKRMAENLRSMGQEGERAAKAWDTMADRISRGVRAAGMAREMGQNLLMPGLTSAGSMEASLNRLRANMDAGVGAGSERLVKNARIAAAEIAKATPFNDQQVIDQAITEQLKAGMSMKEVLGGGAQASAFLATAEGTDIGTANSAVLAMATKFGLSGEQLGRAADLLVRASGASEASAASLKEGLSYVTSAKGLGLTPESTLAMLAMMDKQGFKGSQGGTSMQAFFEKLVVVDQKVSALKFYDDKGQFRGMDEVVRQLRDYFGGMSAEKRDLAAKQLFDTEGSRALVAFLQTGTNSYESMAQAMGNSMGLEQKMGIVSGGQNASWEALQGTAQSTLATLFEPLLAPSTQLAKGLNDLVSGVQKASESGGLPGHVSRATVAATALPALYAGMSFLGGGAAGLKGLGLMRGLGGMGGGVLAGKAMEKMAGIQPVFVVNWPGGSVGGIAGGVLAGVGPTGSGGATAVGGLAGLFKGPVSLNAGTVTLAAGVFELGYEFGTWINEKFIKGKKAQDYAEAYLGTAVLGMPLARGGVELAGAMGWEGKDELLLAAREAQARVGLRDPISRSGGKTTINIHIDDKGDPTVVTEGVDNVDVASSRNGTP